MGWRATVMSVVLIVSRGTFASTSPDSPSCTMRCACDGLYELNVERSIRRASPICRPVVPSGTVPQTWVPVLKPLMIGSTMRAVHDVTRWMPGRQRRPEGFAKIRRKLMASGEAFHFGDCTLDVAERQLLRSATVVRLSPKAFDVLVALVRHPGHLVTKDELLADVWPESFVEEGILTVHVSALRKALGDDQRPPTYIETVARSGYRFIAPVTRVATDDGPPAPSVAPRPVELYEFVGRGRTHLLSGSYFELPNAVDAFRAAVEID